MKVLIVNGSPRLQKNSYNIARYIAGIMEKNGVDHEIIDVARLDMTPCIGCGVCSRTGVCFKNDESTSTVKKFDPSDATIIVSPIYFNSVSGQLKMFIDRFQSLYASKYDLKQPAIDRSKKRFGAFIAVAGAKGYEDQFTSAELIMDLFFKVINTKLIEMLRIPDSDRVNAWEDKATLDEIERISLRVIEEARKVKLEG
ncbi:MAG: flavodoxin family protein [Peptoclostridium sp.]|uniref:flavodoxin family protein n=1 Tax=Peptoclostridium sp. TaxID=1904860 RepID=UPI00139D5979|nr:flavodoxin family protein [Peptoclostridium sp.]MZQ76110.1 flavodoxin family protein [Peptoclostridium sp.]